MHIVTEELLRAFYKLFCLRFCVPSDQWKNSVAKIWQGIWDTFLYENNRNFNSNKFGKKVNFILSFHRNRKKRIQFLISWWSGNEIYFSFLVIESRSLLQRYAESKNFYKRIFLHVIPARVIAPCSTLHKVPWVSFFEWLYDVPWASFYVLIIDEKSFLRYYVLAISF